MRRRSAASTPVAAGRGMLLAGVLLLGGRPGPEPAADPLAACLSGKPVHRWQLPALFREVSGLALADDGRLFLHNDEQGVLGAVDYERGQVVGTYFLGPGTPRADFEGIAIVGPRLFLMTSHGRLYETRVPDPETPDRTVLPFRVTNTGLGRECELEGLAYEPEGQVLLLPCKTPRQKSLEESFTIFRWSLAAGAPATPDRLSFPAAEMAKGRPGRSFHASALERDPRSGRYLVLAGPERAFAVLQPGGAVVATGLLSGHHRQPEGVAIGPDGTVIVSDEGNRGPGRLSVYACP